MPEGEIQFTAQEKEVSQEKEISPKVDVPGEGSEDLIKSLEKSQEKGVKMSKGMMFFFSSIVIIWGATTGFFLARNRGSISSKKIQREVGEEGIKKGTTVGVTDEKTFKDVVEGTLEGGGVDGEGSHHLVRPGGESQNVYLTSSIIDLDQFVDRKVRIWGETFSAQKAGWLMDVGKLEVLE